MIQVKGLKTGRRGGSTEGTWGLTHTGFTFSVDPGDRDNRYGSSRVSRFEF